jgi:arylsulfatase A
MSFAFARRTMAGYVLAAALSGFLIHSAGARDVPEHPNIILIFADDLGYGDTGCYGATKVKTPNIDRLAREGRRFTDAHSASAVCTPARYALLTGEYPFRKDVWGPIRPMDPLVIPTSKLTLPAMLKQNGYATACFGKWHLGFGATTKPDWNAELKPGPLELGFDYYFGLPVVSSAPPYVWVEDRRVLGLDPADPIAYGGDVPTKAYPEKGMRGISGGKAAHELFRDDEAGATLTEKAVKWIRAQRDRSFFLYFATPHIHHPFTPGKRFAGSSECGRYGDFIQEFDWMVGEILRTLDEGIAMNNTLVILTSDNGGMLNQGGQDAWRAGHRINGNLLGFKFDAWEGGHRVPFIARWPNRIEAGSVSDQLISTIDLFATLSALIGKPLPDDAAPDSFDVLSALMGKSDQPPRDHLLSVPHQKGIFALRSGPWLYINAQGGGGFKQKNPGDHGLGGPSALLFAGEVNSDIADGNIKPDAPPHQLYNLANDPSQSTNLASKHPDVVEKMERQLKEIQRGQRTRS